MTRTQPEATIVAAILRRLNEAPRTFARKTHGSRYSVGWPDIVGCTDGVMFAIEVKQPGKKATARQAHELAKWRLAGARAGVATSVAEAVDIVWPMKAATVMAPTCACGGSNPQRAGCTEWCAPPTPRDGARIGHRYDPNIITGPTIGANAGPRLVWCDDAGRWFPDDEGASDAGSFS